MGRSFGPTGPCIFNRTFGYISAKFDRAITNTMNVVGVTTFRIQGALDHSMDSLLPPPGKRPCFAQVTYSTPLKSNYNFVKNTDPNLKLDIGHMLTTVLRESNPYVQFWRKCGPTNFRECAADDSSHNARPTVDEVAAIIVQPENDDEP